MVWSENKKIKSSFRTWQIASRGSQKSMPYFTTPRNFLASQGKSQHLSWISMQRCVMLIYLSPSSWQVKEAFKISPILRRTKFVDKKFFHINRQILQGWAGRNPVIDLTSLDDWLPQIFVIQTKIAKAEAKWASCTFLVSIRWEISCKEESSKP